MNDPDYDRLLQRCEMLSSPPPLVRDLMEAVRVLRAVNEAVTTANALLIARLVPAESGDDDA